MLTTAGGVTQPGIGNPATELDTYTLSDMSQAALRVLRKRKDIACVLVNPFRLCTRTAQRAGGFVLLDSSRKANLSRAYTACSGNCEPFAARKTSP